MESAEVVATPRVPLVGMFFRPPAGIVIKCLLGDSPLMLYAEPENPYDANAIRVECDPKHCDRDTLDSYSDTLEGMGRTPDDVWNEPSIFLGYVAKTHTSVVREHFGEAFPGQGVGGRLGFGGDGKPFVRLDEAEGGE